jgi:hypothetical protein
MLLSLLPLLLASVSPPPAIVAPPSTAAPTAAMAIAAARRVSCPRDAAGLMPLLLRDLPSYTNRVIARSRQNHRDLTDLPSVIVAGQGDATPLAVDSALAPNDPNLQQLFVTTLERQRSSDRMVELQQFHWLFLTRPDDQWALAFSYTRTGGYPQGNQPTTPPRDSTEGAVAQAVKLWLRDCNAGVVRPI